MHIKNKDKNQRKVRSQENTYQIKANQKKSREVTFFFQKTGKKNASQIILWGQYYFPDTEKKADWYPSQTQMQKF